MCGHIGYSGGEGADVGVDVDMLTRGGKTTLSLTIRDAGHIPTYRESRVEEQETCLGPGLTSDHRTHSHTAG